VRPAAADAASIRRLLHRRVIASNRHRAALGRHLQLRANELAALDLLAEHGTLTPSQLGSMLVLTSGGVTSLVQRLERLGHVHRRPHPHDGRSSVLRADAGIVERLARLKAPLAVLLDAEIEALSAADRRTVARLLARVSDATENAARRLLDPRDAAPGEPGGEDEDIAPGLWT
jgi:DNA-binding MarR family transcriptional regulator